MNPIIKILLLFFPLMMFACKSFAGIPVACDQPNGTCTSLSYLIDQDSSENFTLSCIATGTSMEKWKYHNVDSKFITCWTNSSDKNQGWAKITCHNWNTIWGQSHAVYFTIKCTTGPLAPKVKPKVKNHHPSVDKLRKNTPNY